MHIYEATIHWTRGEGDFAKGTYHRSHQWNFDGGATCRASSSPNVVPAPYSDPTAIDPEEAMVAAISSCHMMWFLDVARKAGFIVDDYRDQAQGRMTTKADGVVWLSNVGLHPEISWCGNGPDTARLSELHEEAHHSCYIANSVKTVIQVHPLCGVPRSGEDILKTNSAWMKINSLKMEKR